jgi:hypothetical protein
MPSKLMLKNSCKQSLFVIGASGGDFGKSVTQKTISVDETIHVGSLSDPTTGLSDHWGWVFIGTSPTEPRFQLYIAAGTQRGVFDYAVQKYENGENRNGDTMPGSGVSKTGENPNEVVTYEIPQKLL